MKLFLSEHAEIKLLKLLDYLLENWNINTRNKFIEKLFKKFDQIIIQPESCPKSSDFHNLYKCIVTKHTTFYYRINFDNKEIEIITFFDNRQNPQELKKEVN